MIAKEKKLESMISEEAFYEIIQKVNESVGIEAANYIFPAVTKALEEGDGIVREQILRDWLDVDSMRVCSHCGKIMEEGWYLDYRYACSDDCCMKLMDIGKEEYERYSIYKIDIEEYLEDEGDGRKIEDLSKEEIDEIISYIVADLDAYYYTEWY